MAKKSADQKLYYFIDIKCESREIIGWGIETREKVEIELSEGFHRLFVSKGQYNKLLASLGDN